ncbi:hypothetical protein ACJRPK_08940 [Aquimarina sp. 2-A2]|uniref:DUF3108 domain-containing protein n=1 Tax=Aquimarina sp. 2-A2 TaxID=3382644 RepID=UPI00387F1961
MKSLLYLLLIVICFITEAFSQETPLSPENHSVNVNLVKNEKSDLSWFMIQDTLKIELGKVHTEVKKIEDTLYVITRINTKQSSTQWIDSTIVEIPNFKPLYHSSYNQQREMVLKFGEKVTGYYLDKKTGTKNDISEETTAPYFDSNFYPQLIRWLPLEEGYANTIKIFDYNPTAKIGTMTATIKEVSSATMNLKQKEIAVWKVEVTDDISDNTAISTYYIDQNTRKILQQDIDFRGRKMSMELIEARN